MKKIIALLLVVMLCVVAAGCSSVVIPTEAPTDAIEPLVGNYDLVTFISDGEDYSAYISMLGESSLAIYDDSSALMILNDEKVNLTIDAENMTMTDKTGDTFNFTFDGKTITIVDDGTTMGFDKK